MDQIIQPISSAMFANDAFALPQQTTRELNLLTDDDQTYEDYVATTTDPGNTLLIIAVCICLGSLLSLPFAVKMGRKRVSAIAAAKQRQQEQENRPEVSRDEISEGRNNEPPKPWYVAAAHSMVDSLVMWRHAHNETRVDHGIIHEARASVANLRPNDLPRNINIENSEHGNIPDEDSGEVALETNQVEEGNQKSTPMHHFEMEEDDGDDNNQDSTKQSKSQRMKAIIHVSGQLVVELAKYDNESKRILKLAIPFMTNNIVKTTADLALLAIISQNLGTDSMIAFAMVEVIVGISTSFMMGWIETVNSLGAMAYGAENYELVGQYLQSAILVFVIFQIPTALIWGFSMYKIILLFGFTENAAQIASDYVWVFCANEIMSGIFQAFVDFLGLIDREQLGMVFSCCCDLSQLALAAIVLYSTENANLTIIGLVMLANTCLFVFLTIVISSCKQLTRPYEYGMIGELSLRNNDVMKTLAKTGLPLAVGGLLAYAEWEILTIFAAVLGPAEAATWAILGFVWDVFESTTEAIGDAAEVRCAYQLGKGRPEMAKISAYKSMLLSIVVASIITTAFLCLDGHLPAWLTTDETIQEMLLELFPLMGLGNLTMTVGMVCWALIGAQARYELATKINLATTSLISIPLGAIMTVWLHIDLQGLTFSIVMGYVMCAWIMVIVILVADWGALSNEIRERVANGDLDIESCSTEGSGLYGAYDWDELPDEVRAAAELLGYRQFLWDHDKEPDLAEKDWSELTPEEQEACKVLGYDEAKWNKDDGKTKGKNNYENVAGDESPQKKYSDDPETEESVSYDHLDWDDLPEEVQVAAAKLGFNEDLWDDDEEPEECDKEWDELNEEEKAAARVLGYNEVKWNSD